MVSQDKSLVKIMIEIPNYASKLQSMGAVVADEM